MLEGQQRLLISAIHAMYRKQSRIKSLANDTTPETTPEVPRTQDILQELGLIPPSRCSQSTSKSPPNVPAQMFGHQTVEELELELQTEPDMQSPVRSSEQETLSEELCSWSCDNWLPLSPNDANAFSFEVPAKIDTSELIASIAMETPQQMSAIPTLAGPDLTPQDCTMTYHDPLLYRSTWMLDDN